MTSPNDVEELKRLLREAGERVEQAEKEREEERQRAEQAEKERHEERKRAEQAELQSLPTTFQEYLVACHDLVYSKFHVERNWQLTSKGPITNPRNKWCPTHLQPWPDFLQQQRTVFGVLSETCPSERRLFENRAFLSGLGRRVAMRKISDEKVLETFLHNSVEDPVRAIIDQLKEVEEVRRAFDLGSGIVFENHPHAIGDTAEEVVDNENPSTPPSTPQDRLDRNRLRPDQICVYRSNAGGSTRRTMVYVCEYKPPHKLTAPHLRLGLHPMDIYKDIVNRKTTPTSADAEARFKYHAERLTASAITQTYNYMIEGGLEYGVLTTGEAFVFLRVDWRQPETLLYHLTEPSAEVPAQPDHRHLCTAVGQYLAFSLIALGQPGERQLHGQDERQQVTAKLKTWTEDFETTLRSIPEDTRRPPDSSPAYQPETYESVDRSPYVLRVGRRGRRADEPSRLPPRRDSPESSDDESRRHVPESPTPTGRRGRQGATSGQTSQGSRRSQRLLAHRPRGGGNDGANDGESRDHERPYCTQKCLLGLVIGTALDPQCPNTPLHRRRPRHGGGQCAGLGHSGASDRHLISAAEFRKLLREQLERTLDEGITPLEMGGARGVLFKVSLLAYGYTFVSKATVRAFIKDLEHEAAVYERLQAIQGMHVPVFLGAIDLRSMNKIYYYAHRVYVVHMTFLSWGGYRLGKSEMVGAGEEEMKDMAVRSLRAIHQQGVAHRDVRQANMLFNEEVNGVMVIDFERALLLEPPRRPLGELVQNKRKRGAEAKGGCKISGKACDRIDGVFSEEVGVVQMMFKEHPGRRL